MTNQSPARKAFWALGFVPGRCVLRPGVRRLAGLVLALALGLLAGDTGRALAGFNPHASGGAPAPTARAAHGDDFHFKLRAVDLGRAFRPSDLWELMAESGRVAFKP